MLTVENNEETKYKTHNSDIIIAFSILFIPEDRDCDIFYHVHNNRFYKE